MSFVIHTFRPPQMPVHKRAASLQPRFSGAPHNSSARGVDRFIHRAHPEKMPQADPSLLGDEEVKFGAGESSRRSGKAVSSAEPGVEDSFFLPLVHKRNPFTLKIHQMDNNPAFRREQRAYEGRLDGSGHAKLAKFALGTTLGYGLYYLSQATESTALGIAVGAGASVYFDDVNRSVVKLWHKPPHRLKQKAALDALESETQTGRLVYELGTEWPRVIAKDEDAFLPSLVDTYRLSRKFSDQDEPATLIGTALISRYPEQQAALKSTLPKLRETRLARKVILPSLQQSHRTRGGYGACNSDDLNPAMHKAVDTMLRYADAEREHLEKPINRHAEQVRYEEHLRRTIPKVIEYLSEDAE